MLETIYTIPVNEAFDEADGCPLCLLHRKLEETELDLILGASMMEPQTRIQTNEQGFCAEHFSMMLQRKNRLGLALMLESHLDFLRARWKPEGPAALLKKPGSTSSALARQLETSCYICGRIHEKMEKMVENAVWMWESEEEFRQKTAKQKFFCLPHYRVFLEAGRKQLDRRRFASFCSALDGVVLSYLDSLREDIRWFCKKFDYRYEAEPWGNAKDAPERVLRFLKGTSAQR